jgi:hypothetical protein
VTKNNSNGTHTKDFGENNAPKIEWFPGKKQFWNRHI